MSKVLKSDLYQFVAQMMQLAGQELMARQGANLEIRTKPDTSLVTAADLASERIILEQLRRNFPKDAILSEESGAHAAISGDGIWIIDPLDGTTNYANGYPFFSIAVGRGRRQADGRIVMDLGAVYDPVRDQLFFAQVGQGAFCNDRPLRVAKDRELSKCFLVTGFYYMRGETLEHELQRFARIALQCQTIRRDGSAALDLALVAAGVYDAFWELGLSPWDVAAGSVLVSEAGGTIRNYGTGTSAFNVEGAGLIAGNTTTVAQIAALL